ncbi:response regulator [Candidatus Aalborgicola defluviihabitans]|uniref:response regulator n=1 Tax=Candidatus Aalborgicola defluviihabitans TaxID=3386187 RepID=UPI00390A3B39|nr:response regulator transcription factor [Burkholderiales bacterium]
MSISVLVADDHAIIRDGLRKILADTQDLIVAGEACDGNAALEQVRSRNWDMMLMDLSMPGRHGIELIRLVKAERPKLPILIFSMHPEEQFAVRSIRAGASGYLSKESDSNLLVPAIRKVASGGVFISPRVAELLATAISPRFDSMPHTQLSDREFEIFGEIVRGTSLTDIAAKLSLSIKTVSTHKSNIFAKMNLTSNVDLFRYAVEHELLDLTRE